MDIFGGMVLFVDIFWDHNSIQFYSGTRSDINI